MDMATPDYFNETSKFRQWITQTWYEHKREKLMWEKQVVNYNIEQWFSNNKWFLKRLYKKGTSNDF